MNFLFPIVAALLQASSATLDKVLLSFKRVDYRVYTGVSFPLLFIITLVIFLVVRPPLSRALFLYHLFFLLLISVAFTTITNLIVYRALKHDRLIEIEAVGLLQVLPIILFSSIVFADERRYAVIVPAVIAALAIIWSHWEHHRFQMNKDTYPLLIWLLVAAPVGAVLSKELLRVWDPISLELVRSFLVAILLYKYFERGFAKITLPIFGLFVLTNLFSSIAWILVFYGYQRIGIIHTMLLFSLQPMLVYFASVMFLKERFHWKKSVAFVVVLFSIATAQLLGV